MRKEDNTPALRFPGFEDKWKYNTLGNLLEFKNGINANKDQYGHGVKFINVLDILNNDFITYDKIIGSVAVDENTIDKNAVRYGDILFQRSSETREEVGSASVYLDKEKIATFGGFVIRGKKIADYVPEFFNKLLKTDTARDSITSRSGGSTRFNVGQETLSTVNLAFPSLPEQQKIASFLASVDEKLMQIKQQKALLEQYKKGVMQRIFSQEIRFRDENGKEFPEWKPKTLSQLAKILYGKDQKKVVAENGIFPILGTGGIIGNTNQFLYDKPSVLIGRKGTIDKPVYMDTPFWTVDTLFYTEVFTNTFPKWLFYKFQTINWYLYNEASGVPSLSGSTIYKIKFDLPCIEEQTKIANFLSTLDDKINHCSVQIEKTEQWKKGLLQKMFC